MLIKDDGYMFEIWYYNHKEKADCLNIFSNSPDIYSLDNLPKTTYIIHVLHCDLNQSQETWNEVGKYYIGDRITLEEAKEEIKALENLFVEGDKEKFKTKTLNGLKEFLQNATNNAVDENSDKVFLNKNIDLSENSVDARIKIIPSSTKYQIISTSQIVNGKISPREKEAACKDKTQTDFDQTYISLE